MELFLLWVFSLGNHFFDLQANVEKVRNMWRFMGEFPTWLNYHTWLKGKRKTLKRKVKALRALKHDIKEQLKIGPRGGVKKRKREVKNWLSDVKRKKKDVEHIKKKIGERRFFSFPLLDKQLREHIQEVDELCEQGKFPNGLFLDTPIKTIEPFPPAMLKGRMSSIIIDRIWQWLVSDEVSRIGIHGVKGVGKTAIVTHIYNLILECSRTFEHPYWVTVSQHKNIHDLQDAIAKEIGLYPLNEEDRRKRAAKLYNGLKRIKRSVLILDDILTPLEPENIGFPSHVNACKLIMTCQSPAFCQMMECQQTIKVEPLSDEEAMNLFLEKVHLRKVFSPEMEQSAKLTVRECEGLPLSVIEAARML